MCRFVMYLNAKDMKNVTAVQYYTALAKLAAKGSEMEMGKEGTNLVTRTSAKVGRGVRVMAEMFTPINDSFFVARYEIEKSTYRVDEHLIEG